MGLKAVAHFLINSDGRSRKIQKRWRYPEEKSRTRQGP